MTSAIVCENDLGRLEVVMVMMRYCLENNQMWAVVVFTYHCYQFANVNMRARAHFAHMHHLCTCAEHKKRDMMPSGRMGRAFCCPLKPAEYHHWIWGWQEIPTAE